MNESQLRKARIETYDVIEEGLTYEDDERKTYFH
jgi:hypothetical protein